jgi:hypothetical protein
MRNNVGWLVALVAAVSSAACIYDDGDRCDANMHYVEALAACVCVPNAVATMAGCQLCAEDEVVVENTCVCPEGETKSAEGVCTAVQGVSP